jgi:hypothetical protein
MLLLLLPSANSAATCRRRYTQHGTAGRWEVGICLAHLCGGAAFCLTMFMISSGVLSGSPFLACRTTRMQCAVSPHVCQKALCMAAVQFAASCKDSSSIMPHLEDEARGIDDGQVGAVAVPAEVRVKSVSLSGQKRREAMFTSSMHAYCPCDDRNSAAALTRGLVRPSSYCML